MDQYLTSTCSVSDGDQPLNIRWTHNGQPVVNGDDDDLSVTQMGRRSSVLTIEKAAARHSGRYECLAENVAGKAIVTADLIVIGWFGSIEIIIVIF